MRSRAVPLFWKSQAGSCDWALLLSAPGQQGSLCGCGGFQGDTGPDPVQWEDPDAGGRVAFRPPGACIMSDPSGHCTPGMTRACVSQSQDEPCVLMTPPQPWWLGHPLMGDNHLFTTVSPRRLRSPPGPRCMISRPPAWHRCMTQSRLPVKTWAARMNGEGIKQSKKLLSRVRWGACGDGSSRGRALRLVRTARHRTPHTRVDRPCTPLSSDSGLRGPEPQGAPQPLCLS